ncbi:MAG: GPW/gp25 family protein [Planctomycetaceae bacterium]|jgi:phage baseplate assembly protein W
MSTAFDKAFLGQGWAFPPALDGRGHVATASLEEDVRQAIGIILGTDRGERVMRPDFGAGLNALVFEPMTAATIALARHRVEEALTRWEPRIDQVQVTAHPDHRRAQLTLEIRYRIRASNTFYNLVYPLYLVEGRTT